MRTDRVNQVRCLSIAAVLLIARANGAAAQRYTTPDGRLRVALAKQPFSPNGQSAGPTTMANGGIQDTLTEMNAVPRIDEARLTMVQDSEYGGWKRLSLALGHFADIVAKNERGLSSDDIRKRPPSALLPFLRRTPGVSRLPPSIA